MIDFTFSWSLIVYTSMTLFIGFCVGLGMGTASKSVEDKTRRS